MKILLTGANGQLGNELRLVLERENPGVTDYVDREELDITDGAAVAAFVARGDYSHIINCAAYTAVDRAEEDKSLCHAVNVDGVCNLATAAAAHGIRMVHISTDYVFDGNTCHPYTESDRPAPQCQYGATKRAGETVLMGLCPDAIVVRTGWLYSSFGANFVKTMLRVAGEKGSLAVVADQIGTPTYAADLAEMVAHIVLSPRWVEGTFHYANEGVASWYDFAVAIMDLAGMSDKVMVKPITTADYPTAATRPCFSVLDKSKIKATYGITIPHWRHSLSRCMQKLNINNGK